MEIDGPYGPKLRALWISAWNLGVVRDRTDAAMLAFVERQTRIQRTRFLRAAADARKAVEGLKAWISREGGVGWPASDDPLAVRRAVIAAQWRRLVKLGAIDHHGFGADQALTSYIGTVARGSSRLGTGLDDPSLTAEQLDKVIVALGRKLRKALAEVSR
ncbi:MAG: DUF1018 domain-containing protein [Methylacidiphilales bacterium]|nr:DUF1018 domain-containing protein [Candidatus Methylacidiphilales bacterium]